MRLDEKRGNHIVMRAAREVFKRALARTGYSLRRLPGSGSNSGSVAHPQRGAADPVLDAVRPYTMLSDRRLFSLWCQVGYCEAAKIPGALVECGVWKGGAAAVMAAASSQLGGGTRELHLFDAFTDICEPDPTVDGRRAFEEASAFTSRSAKTSGRLVAMKGFYDHKGGHGTAVSCRQIIERVGYDDSKVFIHEGWFQDTVPLAAKEIGAISVLRIDGDWYASTKVVLDFFYPLVSPGGVVIVDDYLTYDGCLKAVEETLAAHYAPPPCLHMIDQEAVCWIKPAPAKEL